MRLATSGPHYSMPDTRWGIIKLETEPKSVEADLDRLKAATEMTNRSSRDDDGPAADRISQERRWKTLRLSAIETLWRAHLILISSRWYDNKWSRQNSVRASKGWFVPLWGKANESVSVPVECYFAKERHWIVVPFLLGFHVFGKYNVSKLWKTMYSDLCIMLSW